MSNLATLERQPLRQVQNVRQLLINKEASERLQSIATKSLGADKLVKLTIEALRKTPKIGNCDPMSVFNSLIQCATLGLEPNTVQGHAYLIPFGKECTFIIGYKGMADLARRHQSVVSIHADVVYSDDELWDYEYGSEMRLRHKPGPRDGKPTHAYCFVKLVDGEAFTVLPWKQVMKTRDQSQGWKAAVKYKKTDKSPWETHTDRMAAKTALRALANAGEMPMANEFMNALQADDRSGRMDLPSDGPGFDPLDGLTIEGEAEEIDDGDAEEEKPAPKKKPVEVRQNKASPNPKPAAKSEQAVMRDAMQWQNIYNTMAADLLDATSKKDFLDTYGDQLDSMKIEEPDLFKQITGEIDDTFAEKGSGQGAMNV